MEDQGNNTFKAVLHLTVGSILTVCICIFLAIKQIAKDWITGNWYFMDVFHRQIILCNSDVYHCRSIVQIKLDIPVAMALDPTQG